jgi:hypothetical protein
VQQYLPEVFWIDAKIEEGHEDGLDVGRQGHGNLGLAADDIGVAVVAVMAPAPDSRLAHDHERCDFVKGIVHPIGLERGSAAALMPARVGGGGVKHAVKRKDEPDGLPQFKRRKAAAQDEGEPEDGVAHRRAVAAHEKSAHGFARHGALVPLSFGEPLLHGQGGVHSCETVVELEAGIGERGCVKAHTRFASFGRVPAAR